MLGDANEQSSNLCHSLLGLHFGFCSLKKTNRLRESLMKHPSSVRSESDWKVSSAIKSESKRNYPIVSIGFNRKKEAFSFLLCVTTHIWNGILWLFLVTGKPQENPDATEDAYKTLFVGRLAYETDERKLKKEMEEYGPVKSVKIVKDTEVSLTECLKEDQLIYMLHSLCFQGKSRGYGFVEFEEENDMRRAYKKADGKRLEGKNIVVDVERGRTVLDWRPRRVGKR